MNFAVNSTADGGAADRPRPRQEAPPRPRRRGVTGVVGSDRFSANNSLDPEQRQVCWSHLRRDFTFHADLGLGAQETLGLDGLEITWNVFHAWKQFQQDGDRAALRQRVEASEEPLEALARGLDIRRPVADVEPTDNAAERGLRAAVIYRKLSFGSRSQGGERTIEGLLSVDQTCRLQRRSLYSYLATPSQPKRAAIGS